MSSLKICELEPTKPVSKFASPDKKSLRTDNNYFIVLKNPNQNNGQSFTCTCHASTSFNIEVKHLPSIIICFLLFRHVIQGPWQGTSANPYLSLSSFVFPSPSSGCSNDLRFYHHDVAENNGRFLIYGTLTRRAMIHCHCIHDPFTTDDHR